MTKHSLRLSAALALLLGVTAAHADVVPTGSSGYWAAAQGTAPDRGANTCMITTQFPDLGIVVGIVTSSDDQTFRISIIKNSWNIPPGTPIRVGIQFDANPVWRGSVDPTKPTGHGSGTQVWVPIAPASARSFVHHVTSGTILRLYFGGNEQPWTVNLSGTTGIWPQFMNCVQMVAPAVITSLNPTQPFGNEAPATKPTQPFERNA